MSHEDDFRVTRENQLMIVNAMRALFTGNLQEARESDPGVALVIDILADAMVDGATKAAAIDRMEAATEHDRMIAAGVYNLLENMIGQMKNLLAKVGAENHDKHVEVISLGGCGDPNCPGCGGQPFDPSQVGEAMKAAISNALGINPTNLHVEAVPDGMDMDDAVGALKAKLANEIGGRKSPLDKHTNEIMEALDSMPGNKRPRLKSKKLPS